MSRMLILASTSPFRKSLLQNAGISFSAEAPGVDERAIEEANGLASMSASDVAIELAKAKALAVSRRHPDALVIGCDQTMSLGDRAYHKPSDRGAARRQLMELRGRTHCLNSGIVIASGGNVLWQQVETARLSMRNFSESFVDLYLDRVGDSVLQSVGGYQLEAEGIQLFDKVDGDYFTIIGLPLIPLLDKLRDLGELHA